MNNEKDSEEIGYVYMIPETKEIKEAEDDLTNWKNAMLGFLKDNLCDYDYNIAFNYINKMTEKSNKITGLWGKQFYLAGLEKNNNIRYLSGETDVTQYRELVKALLLFAIKQIRELNRFAQQLSNIKYAFKVDFRFNVDLFPIEEIAEILGLVNPNSNKDEIMEDDLFEIIHRTSDKNVEKKVDRFLEKYNL